MNIYTIVPKTGTGIYRIVATGPDGANWLVGTYATEQFAIAVLRRLQEKDGIDPTDQGPLPEGAPCDNQAPQTPPRS